MKPLKFRGCRDKSDSLMLHIPFAVAHCETIENFKCIVKVYSLLLARDYSVDFTQYPWS